MMALAIFAAATACYPPGGEPTNQSVPPGGRVIVQGRPGSVVFIVDATRDLSRVVYAQHDITLGGPVNGAYWHYDDVTKAINKLPVRYDVYFTSISLSPDGRSVVFSSIDPTLQAGPTSVNCQRDNGFLQPLTPMYCAELYRYDLDTASLQQLTGLGGSSTLHQLDPEVSDDGLGVDFIRTTGIAPTGSTYHRLDLTTGAVEDLPPSNCCTWNRGSHVVAWDGYSRSVTSTDAVTGEVTNLTGEMATWVEDVIDDGRFVVLNEYVSDTKLNYHLLDTDSRTLRPVPSAWLSHDLSRYLLLQRNVLPSGDDRLVVAPLPA